MTGDAIGAGGQVQLPVESATAFAFDIGAACGQVDADAALAQQRGHGDGQFHAFAGQALAQQAERVVDELVQRVADQAAGGIEDAERLEYLRQRQRSLAGQVQGQALHGRRQQYACLGQDRGDRIGRAGQTAQSERFPGLAVDARVVQDHARNRLRIAHQRHGQGHRNRAQFDVVRADDPAGRVLDPQAHAQGAGQFR